MKPKHKTRNDLQREVKELKAQLASSGYFAAQDLKKLSTDRIMGSAVIIEMTTLGGRLVVSPFAICDGLSQATIDALTADLVRSYELATQLKPLKANQ
jgi:hypothetical protein